MTQHERYPDCRSPAFAAVHEPRLAGTLGGLQKSGAHRRQVGRDWPIIPCDRQDGGK